MASALQSESPAGNGCYVFQQLKPAYLLPAVELVRFQPFSPKKSRTISPLRSTSPAIQPADFRFVSLAAKVRWQKQLRHLLVLMSSAPLRNGFRRSQLARPQTLYTALNDQVRRLILRDRGCRSFHIAQTLQSQPPID